MLIPKYSVKGKELGKIDAWELEHINGYSS